MEDNEKLEDYERELILECCNVSEAYLNSLVATFDKQKVYQKIITYNKIKEGTNE